MAIWRDKLGDPKRAEGAIQKLLKKAPDDGEAINMVLTGALPEASARPLLARAQVTLVQRLTDNPLDADRAFHVRIAQATGNSALELVVQTLWDQRVGPLYRALEVKLEYPAMAGDTLHEHQAVLDAILARRPAAARAAMRRHMDMTKRRYSKDWKEAVR